MKKGQLPFKHDQPHKRGSKFKLNNFSLSSLKLLLKLPYMSYMYKGKHLQ